MTASRLPSPPPFVPTLTEVVSGDPVQPLAVLPPAVPDSPAAQPLDSQAPSLADLQVELLMQRLRDDLAAHLTLRLQEQVPLWAAEWVQGLGPDLRRWAELLVHRPLDATAAPTPADDREKP